jgi:hypothetical protein
MLIFVTFVYFREQFDENAKIIFAKMRKQIFSFQLLVKHEFLPMASIGRFYVRLTFFNVCVSVDDITMRERDLSTSTQQSFIIANNKEK